MNEAPKSIWRRQWRAWAGAFFWFLLLASVMFVTMCGFTLLVEKHAPFLNAIVPTVAIPVLVVSLVVFGVLFICWLCHWRDFRRMLFGVACLATLIALAYVEENVRGKLAWEDYRREWEAKGERFDWTAFVPPPVPDDQNFFAAPNVAQLLNWNTNENVEGDNRTEFNLYRGASTNWPTTGGSWQKGTLTDLKPWQRYFRSLAATTNAFPVAPQPQTPAADVLLALSCFDPLLDDLRQAGRCPYSRLPLDYETGFSAAVKMLPVLTCMKRCAQLVELRAVAELDNGQSDRALDDVKLLLRLIDSTRNQPFVISHLVRLATTAITIQPVYEGLARHQWSESQLAELESELAKLDFLADFRQTMRGERTCAIATIERERIARKPQYLDDRAGANWNWIVTVSYRWAPAAYFYRNELAFARSHELFVLPCVSLENRIVSPGAVQQAEAAARGWLNSHSPYQARALATVSGITRGLLKFTSIQSNVDMARVACALERYQLAHGEYPASLDSLAPQFIAKLPYDIIGGQPLKYRRTDDGQLVLYSIGWNEKDDGGQVVFNKNNNQVDREEGDWVWRYPVK